MPDRNRMLARLAAIFLLTVSVLALAVLLFAAGPLHVATLVLVACTVLFGVWLGIDLVLVRRRHRVCRESTGIGLGAIVFAWHTLWEPGSEDLAGGVAVVTTDGELECDPERLIRLSRQLAELGEKGVDAAPPGAEDLVKALDASTRASVKKKWPVPRELAGNDRTFVTDVIVFPTELPNGYLDRPVWPIAFPEGDLETFSRIVPGNMWWSAEVDRDLFGLDDDDDPEDGDPEDGDDEAPDDTANDR